MSDKPYDPSCRHEVCVTEGCMQHCPLSRRTAGMSPAMRIYLDRKDERNMACDMGGHPAEPAGLQRLVGKLVRYEWVEWPDTSTWGNSKGGFVEAQDHGMLLIKPDSSYARPRWWPVSAFKWLEVDS